MNQYGLQYTSATLGISLYSYLYPKPTKTVYLSYYHLHFSLQQNQRRRGRNRFCLEGGEIKGDINNVCTSKCKNDKIKGEKGKKGEKVEKDSPNRQEQLYSYLIK
jgi:hypothetical protein